MSASCPPDSPLVAEDHPSTVLVVDDDVTTQAVLQNLLSPHFRVRCVSNGKQALATMAAAEHGIDIVLLDLMLPDQSGFEVFAKLQAGDQLQGIPVIFLTSRIETENEVHGLELGAIDYIHKPIDGEQLLGRLRRHLRAKNLYDFVVAQKAFLEALLEEKSRSLDEIRRKRPH